MVHLRWTWPERSRFSVGQQEEESCMKILIIDEGYLVYNRCTL